MLMEERLLLNFFKEKIGSVLTEKDLDEAKGVIKSRIAKKKKAFRSPDQSDVNLEIYGGENSGHIFATSVIKKRLFLLGNTMGIDQIHGLKSLALLNQELKKSTTYSTEIFFTYNATRIIPLIKVPNRIVINVRTIDLTGSQVNTLVNNIVGPSLFAAGFNINNTGLGTMRYTRKLDERIPHVYHVYLNNIVQRNNGFISIPTE